MKVICGEISTSKEQSNDEASNLCESSGMTPFNGKRISLALTTGIIS